MAFPEAGIGVTYLPVLEPLLAVDGLVDVVEVEPQVFWAPTEDPVRPYRRNPVIESHIAALPQPKSVHSVGCAIGGSIAPDPAKVALLGETARRLDALIVSEHLSFDRAGPPGSEYSTRFFLPPMQSQDSASRAAGNAASVAAQCGTEFAIETGVNYLAPQPGQLSDGSFVASVAEQADCGILLDLHNVWTNERNGRQPVREFVAELPLDRVLEVHVAGGHEHRGYWLDAHSGAVPEPVLDLVAEIVPELPRLRLVNFEIVPEFVTALGLRGVQEQLEAIRRACSGDHRRTRLHLDSYPVRERPLTRTGTPRTWTPQAWENALAAVVTGRPDAGPDGETLRRDPGTALLRELVEESRAGSLAAAFPSSVRLLLRALGSAEVRRMLAGFWHEVPPQPSTATEALNFARFLRAQLPAVPELGPTLSEETAQLHNLLAASTEKPSEPGMPEH